MNRGVAILFCLMVMPVWGQVWAQESESGQKESSRKKKSEIKALLGGSWNTLNLSDQNFETTPAVGFMVGATYKQGRFFYWELGLVYDNSAYTFGPIDTVYADGTFSVKSLDVPITGGINLLSLTSKLVGLRAFISAVPVFVLGVGDNDVGIDQTNTNSFNFSGQVGAGVDVLFLSIEAGYNFGFQDVFKQVGSIPGQAFLALGVRF